MPLLHDVLVRPSALTPSEAAHVRQHPRIGEAMTRGVLEPEQCGSIRHHHERWDGAGYPDALSGDAVPEGAQLLAISDAFDAMTSARPYRAAMSTEEAVAEIDRCAGRQFRPDAGRLLRRALGWLEGP